jgi:uncharacterized radical SAM protein YgiQ
MFLPVSKKDLIDRKISQLDFICITGDAYVDHPSFGAAIISRMLESEGYAVGVIAQPQNDGDYLKLGEPHVAFMITGGNIDSMVSNYTVAGKKRHDDAYSEGGVGGKRPNRALTVYALAVRRLFPEIPVVLGGLEASLRRFAHYDYWADRIMPSVLVDSKADLLLYGMCELTIVQLCDRIRKGQLIGEIRDLRGSCYLCEPREIAEMTLPRVQLDSFERVSADKKSYAVSVRKQYEQQDEIYGKVIIQRQGDVMLVQNPPQRALTQSEFDFAYELPYERACHPMYTKGVPATEEIAFSITHNRGCFGFCNFCSLALHQGRRIQTRSEDSLVNEAELLTKQPGFKGYIHDVGGPTANVRESSCKKQLKDGLCKNKKCFDCPNFTIDHSEYIRILRRLRGINGVKKVFVRSGIRYDFVNRDKTSSFLHELAEHHVSGQLKVAPEHCSPAVLDRMGKPHIEEFERFKRDFDAENKRCGKEQYLVPYFMSSHPGCTLNDAIDLAVYLKNHNIRPEQVQDFYPTPGTISTAMFYSGIDPYTLKPVYVPRSAEDKRMQRALLQYFKPENYHLIRKALEITRRQNLIGSGKNCLIPNRSDNHQNRRNADGKAVHQHEKISEKKRKNPAPGGKTNRKKPKK